MKPLLTTLLLACSSAAVQAATPGGPNAGTILQQVKPHAPSLPLSSEPDLSIKEADRPANDLPQSVPFLVQRIYITNHTAFDVPTLHALVADAEGKDLTLFELGQLAARITDYYRDHGYFLTRAIIPPQTIDSGVVRFEIIEARYGQIDLDNSSQVREASLQATLSSLQGGPVVRQATLDRALLMLSDFPGVTVKSTLKPGQNPGTADLLVSTTALPALSGNAVFDNYGNSYTGQSRMGATINYTNPFHQGDTLSASGLHSGRGLNYLRLAYDSVVNGQGTRLGGAYSSVQYALGAPLNALKAHGSAQVKSLWAKHPLVRSLEVNLYGQLQYDHLQLRDHIDSSAIRTDRSLKTWTMSLIGDARDSFYSGGIITWNFSGTQGQIGFDDAVAQGVDAGSTKIQGGFTKWNANLTRLQTLSPQSSLYLSYSGQWANTNLDASQKMSAGGPHSVRAYNAGVLSGDSGHFLSAELRYELGPALKATWQAVAFIDTAQITINKNNGFAGSNCTCNKPTLRGAGFGLSLIGPDKWTAGLYIATPVGTKAALAGATDSVRAWAEVRKDF